VDRASAVSRRQTAAAVVLAAAMAAVLAFSTGPARIVSMAGSLAGHASGAVRLHMHHPAPAVAIGSDGDDRPDPRNEPSPAMVPALLAAALLFFFGPVRAAVAPSPREALRRLSRVRAPPAALA
jgi:hypothetical protein